MLLADYFFNALLFVIGVELRLPFFGSKEAGVGTMPLLGLQV